MAAETGWRALALGLASALALLPVTASAHAVLVSSQPRPGEVLGTAPGVVVLEFSQALNPRLSSASVTDPAAHRWDGEVTTGLEIRISVTTNQQGIYRVDWNSVSIADGHRVSDSFAFGVRVAAPAAGAGADTGNPQPTDILIGVAKWVEALALLVLVGQQLLLRLARREPAIAWVQPRFLTASVALSAGLVVVWAESTAASGGHSLAAFLSYFGSGLSEVARPVRLGFEALTLVAAMRGWRVLPLFTAAALAGLAASSHAADVEPAWYGVGLDSVHLAAAGLWAGGIAALSTTRPPGGWSSTEGRRLLLRFSPPALVAFAVTISAGALQAAEQVGSPAALVQTAYGKVLLAKIALVAVMLPLSLMAWRLRRPHLRAEAGIAAGVVAAAALLAAFPLPPTGAERAAAAAAVASSPAGLPPPGQLTLGGNAGSVLVGMTIDPGRPGPNRVVAYLLPVQGRQAAAAFVANVVVNGAAHPLVSCGDTCRQATVVLRGGDAVDIDVLGPGGGRAAFTLPALPAARGDALVAQLRTAMHQLSSYEVSETLSSGGIVIRSDYVSQAPDRTAWTVSATSQTVWIGTSQYTRDGPDRPWRVQTGLPALTIPSFVWDYFEPLTNAHVVGTQVVDGVATSVVSTFGSSQATPIWFKFWVDAGGRVRRVEMSAPGHFMTDHYVSFDAPENITAPAGVH